LNFGKEETATPKSDDADLILIDDDPLICQLWSIEAQSRQHVFSCFDCLDKVPVDQLSLGTPIFIDYRLADGLTGSVVARKLHRMGFQNLYYTTGLSADDLDAKDLVRGVHGKEYPVAIICKKFELV
jgi:hypothetical protein